MTLLAVLALAWAWWRIAGDKFDVPVVADPHLARIEAQIV